MVIYDRNVAEREMAKSGVGWFKFDEASGNVTDSKGIAIGTVTGVTRFTGMDGVGKALNFDGNDHVQFNNKVIPVGKKSIRFKIKVDNIPSSNLMILSNSGGSVQHGENIAVNNNGFLEWLSSKATSGVQRFTLASSVNICDGHWHDILLTWDGTTNANGVKIYIDNMSQHNVTTKAIAIETTPATNNLTLGKFSTSNVSYFNGQIDELEIYNDVINPFSIKTLILSENEYKSYDVVNGWQTVSTSFPTIEQWLESGMDDTNVTPENVTALSNDFEVVTWTDDVRDTVKKVLGMNVAPSPQLVNPTSDISLSGVETIDKITLTATGNSKVGISFDSGTTLKAYKNGTWETVSDAHSGMTVNEINALTSSQITEARGDSKFVRFSYSLTDDATVDSIQMKVSMQGEEKIANSSDYDLSYDASTKTIIYNIKKSGTYSVNYIDG